jgi:hypothetical protein
VSQIPSTGKDFESVELGDLEKGDQKEEKAPRRIIHFSSGETMEEYSTDEEEGEDKEPEKKDLLSPPVDAVRVCSVLNRSVCVRVFSLCVFY